MSCRTWHRVLRNRANKRCQKAHTGNGTLNLSTRHVRLYSRVGYGPCRALGQQFTLRPVESMPPLDAIQAALRKTTEVLACELAHPSTQAPSWTEVEWRVARAVASLHGVSPLLTRRLRWRGPAGWQDFLADQAAQTRSRALRLQDLLRLLDGKAREAGVPFVSLKGAALHAAGLYQAGERPMADLDLLTSTPHVLPLVQLLESMQFRQSDQSWKHLVFEQRDAPTAHSFGEHAGNGLKIDLHTRIAEMVPRRAVDITIQVLPEDSTPGLNAYPSPAALMAHLLLHAAGAMVFRSLRLVQLHDMALLSAQMSPRDWDELIAGGTRPSGLWWALPPLAQLKRYYGTVPARVEHAAAAACPPWLQRTSRAQLLSDISYSDLHRVAFPGLGWVRSASEIPGYIGERILLGALAMAGGSHTRTGPKMPSVRNGSPPALQRWTTWRPVRPLTLTAVRLALAQPS